MEQEVKASVQYGDLVGEISCDGHGGPFLHDLAKAANVPNNYFPIAASVYVGEMGSMYVHIYACDQQEYGNNVDEIRKAGIRQGKLKVKNYEANIKPSDIMRLIKRLDIFAKNRAIADIPIVISDQS